MQYNKLTPQEEYIMINKGTERPFSGEYENFFEDGIYVCKRCDSKLFTSESKFHSNCGWPSFESCIKDSIIETLDSDKIRMEIICANCKGHLGHVFRGEGFTETNTRHCVNSLAIKFIKNEK